MGYYLRFTVLSRGAVEGLEGIGVSLFINRKKGKNKHPVTILWIELLS
jgi:hypothetical protein